MGTSLTSYYCYFSIKLANFYICYSYLLPRYEGRSRFEEVELRGCSASWKPCFGESISSYCPYDWIVCFEIGSPGRDKILAVVMGLPALLGCYWGSSETIAETLIVPTDYFSAAEATDRCESPPLIRNPWESLNCGVPFPVSSWKVPKAALL